MYEPFTDKYYINARLELGFLLLTADNIQIFSFLPSPLSNVSIIFDLFFLCLEQRQIVTLVSHNFMNYYLHL